MTGHRDRPMLGVATSLLAIFLFVVMDSTVKWLGADYPTQQIMFFRSAVALVPVAIFLFQAGGLSLLKTRRPVLHFLRCALGTTAMACAFYGFSVMKLADAASVFHTAPLIAVAFSVPILGEQVGIRRWLAVLAGLTGALIVARPGSDVFATGSVFMLTAAVLVALTTTFIRLLNQTDHPTAITFYFTAFGTVVSTVACIVMGWETPTVFDLGLLCGVGLLGGTAQYFMTLSFRYAQVSVLSPFKYLAIVFSGAIGFFVWGEIPDRYTVGGICLILVSGLYTIHRETRLAKSPSQPGSAVI
ncbi:MAG: DMT family transporter [Pseudomonadota bacterium]